MYVCTYFTHTTTTTTTTTKKLINIKNKEAKMVSRIRQARRDRLRKHIPSPKAWDRDQNKWIDNPEVKEKKEKKKEVNHGPRSNPSIKHPGKSK